MYKYLIIGAVSLFSFGANAQSSFYIGNITTQSQRYTLTGCDSNEKTPKESVECKIKYWEDEIKDKKDAVEKAQKALDNAKERLEAFKAIK
jgi:hypothetical protein